MSLSAVVTANIRAEMSVQRKTPSDLAAALHLGYRAALRRWNGDQDFGLGEIEIVAVWLGCRAAELMKPRRALSDAS